MPTTSHSPFPVTQWTSIVEVCRSGGPEERQRAIERLCTDYWYPLYAFARKQGRSREDAEDLTQGLFHYLLEREMFSLADPRIGRLRTFLLTIFQRYMNDVRSREQASKRGGGKEIISLDADEAEHRFSEEPMDEGTPEEFFDRSWAMSVLDGALQDLGAGETKAGKGQQFENLKCFLNPQQVAEGSYDAVAKELGVHVEAVRKMVSRLRGKFRDCLRLRIAATLCEPSDTQVDEELTALKAALRG